MRTVPLAALALVLTLPVVVAPASAQGEVDGSWRLGIQAWSFHRTTFFEAVDRTASLGLRWIEAYPGQPLGTELPGARIHHTMPPEQREAVRAKLAQSGVTLVNYGVVELPEDEAECRRVFEFAREMGIETVVSEPPPERLEAIDRLCGEYRIHVALHNHPTPSRYWNPDTVLEAVDGRSEWIGACADTGHWMRSGVRPLDAVRKLRGRLVSFHLKDLDRFGDLEAHDVPWGTGEADLPTVLAELRAQGFHGVFSIEYEYNWDHSLPEIRQCVEFFRREAAASTGARPEAKSTLEGGQALEGRRILDAMVARYRGRWFDRLFLRQKMTYFADGVPSREEIASELLLLPGRVRSDYGAFAGGNCEIYRNGAFHVFRDGKPVREATRIHPVLLLGFDIYLQEPDVTARALAEGGFDLARVHEAVWNGRPALVVGASEGEATSNQFWVERERLLVVRILYTDDRGLRTEFRMDRFEPVGEGWLATRLEFRRDANLLLREEYLEWGVPDTVDPALFRVDPLQRRKDS